MMCSVTYNKRNDFFCAQKQHITKSVTMFRIESPKQT